MDWVAAKSYYIGYNAIDRFLSIIFIHNYLITWSISLIISLILPLLFLILPSSLQTTRTIHFFLICIVCLSNMFCLYFQIYMISGLGEPNLSFHTCRFIVYISTFAKPIGIYLTFLFSIERLFIKILSKFFLNIHNYRKIFQKLFKIFIFLGLIFIFSIRLYEVLKYITKIQSNNQTSTDDTYEPPEDITDILNNSTDRNISFQYCFKSMNIDTYAKILSFYVIQYWFEYIPFIIIILIFVTLIIQQYRLPISSSSRFSLNTKLYLSLGLCLILSECILLFFHFIVDDKNNNNTDVQLASLEFMLFSFNFRCIFLPFIIFLTICYPLKQVFYEFFILQSYIENINENDNQQESSSNHSKNKFRRKFKNDHLINDDL